MTKQRRLPSPIALTTTGAAALLLLSGSIPFQGTARAMTAYQQEVPPPPPPPVPPVPPDTQPPPPPTDPNALPPQAEPVNDIATVAAKDSRLSTLVKAIQAAGLTETLSGKTSGPYTLFGPLNSAFSRLPSGKLDSLLKPENKEQLVTLLKNHLVAGRLTKEDLAKMKEGDELTTLAGTKLKIGAPQRGTPTIGGARVVAADILTDNGVIHIISAVLVPQAEPATTPVPPPGESGKPAGRHTAPTSRKPIAA